MIALLLFLLSVGWIAARIASGTFLSGLRRRPESFVQGTFP